PRMPWDGTELRVGTLTENGLTDEYTLKGGVDESVISPTWADDSTLYLASDWPGFWNLYQAGLTGQAIALHPAEEEFHTPPGHLGHRSFQVLDSGRILTLHGHTDMTPSVYDPHTLDLTPVSTELTTWSHLHSDGKTVVAVASAPDTPPCLVHHDPPPHPTTSPPAAPTCPLGHTCTPTGKPSSPTQAHPTHSPAWYISTPPPTASRYCITPPRPHPQPPTCPSPWPAPSPDATAPPSTPPCTHPHTPTPTPMDPPPTSYGHTVVPSPTPPVRPTRSRPTSPAVASASSTSTTAVPPAMDAPTASASTRSGGSSTSRTASRPPAPSSTKEPLTPNAWRSVGPAPVGTPPCSP